MIVKDKEFWQTFGFQKTFQAVENQLIQYL